MDTEEEEEEDDSDDDDGETSAVAITLLITGIIIALLVAVIVYMRVSQTTKTNPGNSGRHMVAPATDSTTNQGDHSAVNETPMTALNPTLGAPSDKVNNP